MKLGRKFINKTLNPSTVYPSRKNMRKNIELATGECLRNNDYKTLEDITKLAQLLEEQYGTSNTTTNMVEPAPTALVDQLEKEYVSEIEMLSTEAVEALDKETQRLVDTDGEIQKIVKLDKPKKKTKTKKKTKKNKEN